MRLALLALLLIPACWAFYALAPLSNGLAVGRSADLVLAAGCLLGGLLALERRWPAQGIRAWLRSPLAWGAAALAWQALVWSCAGLRGLPWLPGLSWLLERAAALALGWILWEACLAWRIPAPRLAWGLALSGALVLMLSGLARLVGPAAGAAAAGPSLSLRGLGASLAQAVGALGVEPPFGNQNFNIASAMPLLGAGLWLWWRERQGRPGWWGHLLLAAGWAGALLVAAGVHGDGGGRPLPLGAAGRWLAGLGVVRREASYGAVVQLLVLGGMLGLHWLPRHRQLGTLLAGVLLFLTAQLLVVVGAVQLPAHSPPSTVQRIWLWRCAGEAAVASPLAGWGVGTAVAVLPLQEHFSETWMAVPSFPEHAHDELLESLVDGGLVNAILLAGLLAATLVPLWRRRDEPAAWALLIAWALLLAHANLDVQFTQPGPLLLLAMLAGVSWAVPCEGEEPPPQRPPAARGWSSGAVVLAGAALALFVTLEVGGLTGTVPELYERWSRAEAVAGQDRDTAMELQLLGPLMQKVGPLDVLYYERAHLEIRPAPGQVESAVDVERRLGIAGEDCLAQARILPVDPDNLMLMAWIERRCRQRGDGAEADRLQACLERCLARAELCERRVEANDKNQGVRARLDRLLGRAGLARAAMPGTQAPAAGASASSPAPSGAPASAPALPPAAAGGAQPRP